MSLEEVMDRLRESGDIHVIFYETTTGFQVCVGDPLRRRKQRLRRFSPARKHDAAAWLHRTILLLYPHSAYAACYGGSVGR